MFDREICVGAIHVKFDVIFVVSWGQPLILLPPKSSLLQSNYAYHVLMQYDTALDTFLKKKKKKMTSSLTWMDPKHISVSITLSVCEIVYR